MRPERRHVAKASPVILPVVLVGVWWITSSRSSSLYFPPLGKVLRVLQEDWLSSRIRDDLLPSLACLFGALLISTAIAVVAGAAIGVSDMLYRAMQPILDILRSCPGVALVPVSLAVFGIGTASEIAVISFATIWPMLLNVIDGVRLSTETYDEVRRNLRMSYVQRIRFVDLPASLPQFMAGLYTSLAIGVVVMIASEYYSSVRGVGFYIASAEHTFSIAQTYAGVIVLGVIGYTLSLALRRLEHVVLRWRVGVR